MAMAYSAQNDVALTRSAKPSETSGKRKLSAVFVGELRRNLIASRSNTIASISGLHVAEKNIVGI